MMPGWYWSGVMLQSDQFWRLTKTSVRRRATCFSYCDGTPYSFGGIGLPSALLLGGTGSVSARAAAPLAAPATAVPAASVRLKNLRLSWDSSCASSSAGSSFLVLTERARVATDLSDIVTLLLMAGRR